MLYSREIFQGPIFAVNCTKIKPMKYKNTCIHAYNYVCTYWHAHARLQKSKCCREHLSVKTELRKTSISVNYNS